MFVRSLIFSVYNRQLIVVVRKVEITYEVEKTAESPDIGLGSYFVVGVVVYHLWSSVAGRCTALNLCYLILS